MTLLKITAAITLAFAHQQTAQAQNVKIGPNGGRVLEFKSDQTIQAEVIEKERMFHIALFDKDMKPIAIEKQTLTATTADRSKPEKLTVEIKEGKFVTPVQKGGDHWTIFQFRSTAEAKPVTARLHYDVSPCGECGKAEWLCECHGDKTEKK